MNKPIGRRGVLALLGSAPFAAKEAAAPSAEAATNVATVGRKVSRPWNNPGAGKIKRSIIQLLQVGGKIPAHKLREWRNEARENARTLDPDIASLRSVSLATKVRMQEERVYDRAVTDYIESYAIDKAWNAWKESLGKLEEDDDWED